MNRTRRMMLSLVGIVVLSGVMIAQSARVQIIHNAADPAADTVDVYLDGTLLLDNFAFRTATPFIDAPADVEINVGIAPGNSTSAADTIKNFTLTLTSGEAYVAVANGVLTPANFESNPDGRSTTVALFIKTMAREAGTAGNVEFAILHGITDAPSVDIRARDVAQLVDNASYGDVTEYLTVPVARYLIDVLDSAETRLLATFDADLTSYDGVAGVIFASGFSESSLNQDGPSAGLFAALPDGNVVSLDLISTARLQVIHNSADPAADTVDVYLDGTLLLDNFAFRTATPFIDAPAMDTITIQIAPGNSTSAADAIASFDVLLTPAETYVAVANGVLTPGSFEPNPDGRSTAFTLFVKTIAQETGTGGNVDFTVVHGSTDAPTVDVDARGVGTLVNNAAYGDITEYLSVPAALYTLDVKDSSGSTTVASYAADLSGLSGGAAVVFASGFLTPATNQNGPPFGLYAALATGTVLPFSLVTLVAEGKQTNPMSFSLEQNYPNPFNPTTKISFSLPVRDMVTLKVYNILGTEVATLVRGEKSAGTHDIVLDATSLASGVYFYRVETTNFTATRRMLLVR